MSPNVGGSPTFLESMVANGVDAMVLSSTCATFGMPMQLPISGDHPSIRSVSTAPRETVERIMQEFDRFHSLRSLALGCFIAAGADPDGEAGKRRDPETHLIPRVLAVPGACAP